MDPGGRNQRAAAPSTPPGQEAPDWSPDGTRLAFEVTHTSIWVAEIDGAAKEVFTCSRPCWRVQHPSWSPDGTELAFMVAETKNGSTTSRAAVVTMDLATSTVSTAYEDTSGRVSVYGPRWSPDRLQLVFEADTFATDLLSEERITKLAVGRVPATGGPVTWIDTSKALAGGPASPNPTGVRRESSTSATTTWCSRPMRPLRARR